MCTGTHPFIPAISTARLELIYMLHGQRVENVVHLQTSGVISGGDITNLAVSVEGIYATTLATQQSADAELVLVRATDISIEDSYQREVEPAGGTNGDLPAAALPGNVTVATKFTSGLSGRSKRGRAFWIGLTEVQVVGNTLAGGVADAISTAWEDFFAGLNALEPEWEHVVVSYCSEGDWRTAALVTPVEGYSTDFYTDSQRRRLTGRGL